MSDFLHHECGIALIRLRKPLDYYVQKYGTAFYGLNKMFLLMQKQINRGQDGVGLVTVKLESEPGTRYISRKRCNTQDPVRSMFEEIYARINDTVKEEEGDIKDAQWLQDNIPYTGEVLLGHLRYGTHGGNSLEQCHPFLRQSNWRTRTLALAGNFNMTNVDELFGRLVELGQHPKEKADTITMLEKIGHFQEREVQRMFDYLKKGGKTNQEITEIIADTIDVRLILENSAKKLDGGYAMAGIMGHGDAFVMRDPNGIRPAFYFEDEEVVVIASERAAIQSVFAANWRNIHEIPPGHAAIIKRNGNFSIEQFVEPSPNPTPCSFERIYFSRGNDRDIYSERKKLGELLAERVLESVNYDFDNTVFSYIPNTAESAYYGLVIGLDKALNRFKKSKLMELAAEGALEDGPELDRILNLRPRLEKIVNKDVKMRTFITNDASRSELVSHVYDVTYGIVRDFVDTLVLVDDSIVRGTTLEQSILKIVSRLKPKKIIIVSSAPQIRFPDCYGIDMSKAKDFVAFQAMVSLLRERGLEHKLQETYELCKASMKLPREEMVNHVKDLYDLVDYDDVTKRIAQIVRPKDILPEVEVVYQTVEGLHKAIPTHNGDWYFTGNYPTPGGNRVANLAFIYFMEGKNLRAY